MRCWGVLVWILVKGWERVIIGNYCYIEGFEVNIGKELGKFLVFCKYVSKNK